MLGRTHAVRQSSGTRVRDRQIKGKSEDVYTLRPGSGMHHKTHVHDEQHSSVTQTGHFIWHTLHEPTADSLSR